MKYEETAKSFDYHCPYTNEMCKEWECDNCPVEQSERELTEVWQGYGTTITAPKGTFDKIFNDEED